MKQILSAVLDALAAVYLALLFATFVGFAVAVAVVQIAAAIRALV